ncbi:MAG: thioredoxin family protein [Bacteroidia bacterium]
MTLKKYFILLLILTVGTQYVKAQEGMQFFHGTWEELKAEAKKQNKPIFMDAFTTWCGPCKRMSANIFPQPAVGEFYNKNFINYKLDMEKGEGPAIAKQFNVAFYPSYLFFNANGELIHRSSGAKGPEDFIKDGKTAIDPNASLYGQINRFKKGDRDPAFMQTLLGNLGNLDAAMQKDVLDIYWKGKNLSELGEKNNWAIFRDYDNDVLGERYTYVYNNRKALAEKLTKDEVEGVLINKAGPQMQTALETGNEELYKRVHEVLHLSDKKEIKKFNANSEVLFQLVKKDMKAFNKLAPVYVTEHVGNNSEDLNMLAWAVYKHADDDKEALKNAETWAKKSVDIKKSFVNTDTYAAVLYKNKKYKEAESMANEAIKLGKADGEDITATTQLLEKIRKEMK